MARLFSAIAAMILAACVAFSVETRPEPLQDTSGLNPSLTEWAPSIKELCLRTGANGTDPPTPVGFMTRTRFADEFKNRYRRHTPMMAIGLRFQPSGRIELLMPARMEPWTMDRLAIATWKESETAFGHTFDIDLFATYIGTAPIKVGELRTIAGKQKRVKITYQFPQHSLQPLRNHSVRQHPM